MEEIWSLTLEYARRESGGKNIEDLEHTMSKITRNYL